MATVSPFPAVMPATGKAKQIAAPPYDVVTVQEASQLVAGNPLSFLRVGRAEIELPLDADPHDGRVYSKALSNYRRLCDNGHMVHDGAPHLYVYALEMDGRRQVGVVAAVSVDEYDNGIIKKHEKTRRVKEDDRTRHIMTLRSQTGPVFLTYRDRSEVDAAVSRAVEGEPLFDFVAHADIRHTGWRIPEKLAAPLAKAFQKAPALYIADGHHRAASASRARKTLSADNPGHTGTEQYNRFLAVIFPASHVHVLPYNRIVHDLNGMTPAALLDRLAPSFELSRDVAPAPKSQGNIHMYLAGTWWGLRFTGSTDCLPPVERLDVSLLQALVLGPHFGIFDPRIDHRLDFVGGIRGTKELEDAVGSGQAAVAFSMYPTSVDELMAISDANGIMPPKSTWFEPKLRDGLFVHDI